MFHALNRTGPYGPAPVQTDHGLDGWVGSDRVPVPLLERARTSLRLRALDLRDRVGGRADPLVPPRRMHFVGHADSDFAATGDEFLNHFRTLGDLRPTDRVLDIGCGIGRMARPLARFLGVGGVGSYDGFDVNPDGIAWCAQRYGGDHPNFTFTVADLFNSRYNPAGTQSAADFTFPYTDGRFDFALATSVFTHLLEGEAERYLAQAARTLAPGGRLFATWFLLDDDSRAALAAGRAAPAFPEPDAHVSLLDGAVPEEAVAFDRAWLTEVLQRHGLTLTGVHEGSWRGETVGAPTFQDIIVATKAGAPA
jgi:SAM-dependent methyltransferase